jgi:hypothetical protein
MPIEVPQPPDDVVEAVRLTVGRRSRPRARRLRRALGAAPAPASVSTPQRVYAVGLEALAGPPGTIEDAARPTGWRFLVERPQAPIAAAEVHDATRATVPAQLTEGAHVRSTAAGLRAAEGLAPVQDAEFELRLLRVPALHLLAHWLHATDRDDLFVPIAPAPRPFDAARAYPEREFAEAAAALARRSLDARAAAERPDELGG